MLSMSEYQINGGKTMNLVTKRIYFLQLKKMYYYVPGPFKNEF